MYPSPSSGKTNAVFPRTALPVGSGTCKVRAAALSPHFAASRLFVCLRLEYIRLRPAAKRTMYSHGRLSRPAAGHVRFEPQHFRRTLRPPGFCLSENRIYPSPASGKTDAVSPRTALPAGSGTCKVRATALSPHFVASRLFVCLKAGRLPPRRLAIWYFKIAYAPLAAAVGARASCVRWAKAGRIENYKPGELQAERITSPRCHQKRA